MKKRELHRKQTEKLNDLELEAKEKAEYLLDNANAQRMEQEDEVKHLNEVGFLYFPHRLVSSVVTTFLLVREV